MCARVCMREREREREKNIHLFEVSTKLQLGSIDDLVAFRKKLQSLGLKLMLDFVPNHTAVDCKFILEAEGLMRAKQAFVCV